MAAPKGAVIFLYGIIYMNRRNIIKKSIFLSLLFTLFASCASSKKANDYIYNENEEDLYIDSEVENEEEVQEDVPVTAPEITEDFIGDFNPILIKSTIVLLKSGKNMKPKELSKTYLIPTTNKIEIHFRDNVNQVCIILDYNERAKIKAAADKFFEQYETKTLSREKVSKKTAYNASETPLYFGVAGYGNGTEKCAYYTNSEVFNKHAYFLINFTSTRVDPEKGSGFTPTVRLYFSPNQLKDFLEILDQEYLNSQVQELREKAYNY